MANGFMRVDGAWTKTGIFTYGNRRELRLPEEVFHADAMESYDSIPVVDGHPAEARLDANNTSKYVKGYGSRARQDGDFLVGQLLVTDAGLIAKMNSGTTALSVGYEVDLEEKAGDHPVYGRYDAIQRSVRANHLAIVPAGRAGPDARVRMDTAEYLSSTIQNTAIIGVTMDVNVKEQLEAALKEIAREQGRADAAEKALAAEKVRADAAQGNADTTKAELAKVEASRNDAEKLEADNAALMVQVKDLKTRLDASEDSLRTRLRDAVTARVKLESSAAAVLGADARLDAEDKTLMVAVIERLQGIDGSLKDQSETYLRSRMDGAVDSYRKGKTSLDRARDAVASAQKQARVERRQDAASAHDIMVRRSNGEKLDDYGNPIQESK